MSSDDALMNRRNIQVIRSQNYGSVAKGSEVGAFGASPEPPMAMDVQHNQHLSAMGNVQRSRSDPLVPQQSPSKLRGIYNAAIHSPLLRTYSPHITAKSRRSSAAGMSDGTPQHTPYGRKSPFIVTPGTPELMQVKEAKVGVWGAGFTIINLFLGLGLLSFPYALAEGSFTSIAILAFTCVAMSYTGLSISTLPLFRYQRGKLIVRCFNGLPPEQQTYHQVGFNALNETFSFGKKKLKWGNFGMGLVTFGILLEFVGALCMSTIFIWDNISYLAPDLDFYWIILISSVAVLPTCWMLNVSELAFNAFLGCVCKVFTVAVIVGTFFANTSVTETTEYDYTPISPTHFSVSVGIFILSYAGHACLPEIYTSMEQPEKFEKVLDICFIIMFFTYSGMALFGYLQYGRATAVIITQNLVSNETSTVQIVVAKTLIGLVIASCYFQVSPILSVVAAIPEDFIGIEKPMRKRMFRTALFIVVIVGSWAVMTHLAVLEAVTGSLCTMITSVICPSLFYFGLNRKSVTWKETVLLFTYLIAGVLIGIFLLYNDILAVATGQQ